MLFNKISVYLSKKKVIFKTSTHISVELRLTVKPIYPNNRDITQFKKKKKKSLKHEVKK
jgi:hypothetical protein